MYGEKVKTWEKVRKSFAEQGWSFENDEERTRGDVVIGKKGPSRTYLWLKYSKYHENGDGYFFSLDMEWLRLLRDDSGGVVFLMPGVDHALLPFKELFSMLDPATRTKGNEVRFRFRTEGNRLWIYPGGTGEWIDITRFRGASIR